MSDTDLETRRRRIKYRAWHRGLRELDLMLGRFADAHLSSLDEREIAAFEALMDVPDQIALGWLMGEAAPDAEHDTALWQRLRGFLRQGEAR